MITFMEMSLLGEEPRTPSVSCCCSSCTVPIPGAVPAFPTRLCSLPPAVWLFGFCLLWTPPPLPLCAGTQMLSWLQLSLHPELGELREAWACGIAVQIHHGL